MLELIETLLSKQVSQIFFNTPLILTEPIFTFPDFIHGVFAAFMRLEHKKQIKSIPLTDVNIKRCMHRQSEPFLFHFEFPFFQFIPVILHISFTNLCCELSAYLKLLVLL